MGDLEGLPVKTFPFKTRVRVPSENLIKANGFSPSKNIHGHIHEILQTLSRDSQTPKPEGL